MIAPYYVIRSARYASGMTQAEAAKAIGMSPTSYRKAEMGKPIRVGTWKKISDYYCLEKLPQYAEEVRRYNSSDDERYREIESRML